MGWTDYIAPVASMVGGVGLMGLGAVDGLTAAVGSPTAAASPWLMGGGAGLVSSGLIGITNINAANTMADAAKQAASTQAAASNQGIAAEKQSLGQEQGNTQPYLNAGMAANNRLSGMQFNPGNFYTSPGYNWRLSQGLTALQNRGNQGGMMSSATDEGMQRYAQDYASNEYGNWFKRQLAGYQAGLQPLEAQAGYGADAVGSMNRALSAYGQNVAGLGVGGAKAMAQGQMGAANAYAGGQVGAANALSNGINSSLNFGLSAQMMQHLLAQDAQNPQNKSTYTPYVPPGGWGSVPGQGVVDNSGLEVSPFTVPSPTWPPAATSSYYPPYQLPSYQTNRG